MSDFFLGPMDPAKFMESFMPLNSSGIGDPPNDIDFKDVYDQSAEKEMYQPFIDIADRICTNFVAKFTGDRPNAETSLKPDITFLSKNNPVTNTKDFTKASPATSFQHMEMFVEFKLDVYSDPFRDPDPAPLAPDVSIERNSDNGAKTRGQCALYAANHLAYQHRVFAFSIVICGKIARFIRWDREGVVVSAGIDCSAKHCLVVEFLRRFNQLTPEQRGFDPTARLATPGEATAFESAVASVEIESLKSSVGDPVAFPRYRLEVPNADQSVSHYVVGKALDHNLGIIGRCTRGYLALDLSTKKAVFLKDMWRPDVPGIEPEHVWYEKLVAAEVPNLVGVKHGSDVVQPASTTILNYYGTDPLEPGETTSRPGAQRGLTHYLVGMFSSKPVFQGYIHYRLVQPELCRPLSEFTDSRHLVIVVLGSMKACVAAFELAKVFHRDASLGNIMIGLDDEGRLNDWDLCRGVDVERSLEGPRTGTWQFISTRLLENPGAKHTLTDDLESHFFVLMWVALHWVKHDKAPGDIDMSLIFDQQRTLKNGVSDGGMGKSEMYKNREKELHEVQFACAPFDTLFWALWQVFSKYNKQRWEASGMGGKVGLDYSIALDRVNSGPVVESAPQPEPFVSPQGLISLFEQALDLPGWFGDKVEDQFPRHTGVSASRMPLPQMESVEVNLGKRQWISEGAATSDIKVGEWAKRQKRE